MDTHHILKIIRDAAQLVQPYGYQRGDFATVFRFHPCIGMLVYICKRQIRCALKLTVIPVRAPQTEAPPKLLKQTFLNQVGTGATRSESQFQLQPDSSLPLGSFTNFITLKGVGGCPHDVTAHTKFVEYSYKKRYHPLLGVKIGHFQRYEINE